MSGLRAAVGDYLATRRALGFKLHAHERLLRSFVSYLQRRGADRITIDLAVEWATQPADTDPLWWSRRLSVVRGFARHMHALDPDTEIPPADLLPMRAGRITPHLYSPADIAALLQVAGARRHRLHTATCQTLIGLLAVTGMRVGEACRLNRADVDLDAGVLTITGSKYGKSRQVPVHASTVAALRAYAELRDRLSPKPTPPSFFVSTRNTRLRVGNVCAKFTALVHEASIQMPPGRRRIRIHDLRHSFAVATLLDWYREGVDTQARLPLLTTYLGHVDPKSTYWYLQAAPELLALAAQRLERHHPEEAL
jgi:integrase/recombinase XerD